MKNIIRLNESDLTKIVRRTLLELDDRDEDMDIDMIDDYEDDETEEYVSDEERQHFINYVCRLNRSWCPKTKQFFSQMV